MRFYQGTIFAAVLSFAAVSAAQNYHVAEHWKLGGQGGWDYLLSDDGAHRLYIAHNSRVEVVDSSTGKLLGRDHGSQEHAWDCSQPDGKTGYISDGAGNAIVVFNRVDFSIKATVAAGTNPDGIAYEPSTKTVWAFNGRSRNVSVFDTSSNTVVATVPSFPGSRNFRRLTNTARCSSTSKTRMKS